MFPIGLCPWAIRVALMCYYCYLLRDCKEVDTYKKIISKLSGQRRKDAAPIFFNMFSYQDKKNIKKYLESWLETLIFV